MKIKKVEFFGVNGVGKSYSEAILRNLLDLRKINTVNRREAIVFHSQNVVELNILDKITLSYFKLIEKFKKPKLNRQKTFSSKIKKARDSPFTILAKFVIMNCLIGVIADLPYFIFSAWQRISLISVNFMKPNKGRKNHSEVDPRASDAIR